MRSTVRFDEDVAAALERLRRERGMGLSEIVNDLLRRGLRAEPKASQFRQTTRPLGLQVDVTNVADSLEELDPFAPGRAP
jgi:hypothetical protein